MDVLAGRLLLSALFIVSGIWHITHFPTTVAYFNRIGVPVAEAMGVITIMVELGGGILLAIGWRRRWLAWFLAGFVLVARAEPSVLRAAVMGTVALIGMGANGRDRGTRALGVATLELLLLEPGLQRLAGLPVAQRHAAMVLRDGWRAEPQEPGEGHATRSHHVFLPDSALVTSSSATPT